MFFYNIKENKMVTKLKQIEKEILSQYGDDFISLISHYIESNNIQINNETINVTEILLKKTKKGL